MDGAHLSTAARIRQYRRREFKALAPVRTVLVTMLPLLSEIIIQSIRKDIELEVVTKIDNRSEVEETLRHTDAELIMIGLRAEEPDAIAATILEIKPRATVVVFSPDCRNACLHERGAFPTNLIPLNPDKLANAILTSLSRPR